MFEDIVADLKRKNRDPQLGGLKMEADWLSKSITVKQPELKDVQRNGTNGLLMTHTNISKVKCVYR